MSFVFVITTNFGVTVSPFLSAACLKMVKRYRRASFYDEKDYNRSATKVIKVIVLHKNICAQNNRVLL